MKLQNLNFIPFPVEFKCSEERKNEVINRFKKNLDFFKENLPEFYEEIENYFNNIKNKNILLTVFEDDYDLIFNKASVYPKGAKNYELPYRNLTSFTPPRKLTEHKNYPFHSLVLVNTIKKVINYLKDKPTKNNVFTLFFVAGLGLGLYLEKLIKENYIKDLVILEDEFPIFLASLFTIDWEKIYKLQTKKGSLRLVINKSFSEENFERYILLLKTILDFYPYRASLVAYGIHYKYPGFENILKDILSKYFTYTKGLGFYDDERLAIDNAFYIFKEKYKYLKDISKEPLTDIPVVLIGSGPSLKNNIEDIKKLKDKALIVACGSALASLYKYEIKPHIFINMERVPEVKNIFRNIPKDFLKDIYCFTTDNTHPEVLKFFEKDKVFIYPRGGSAPAFLTRPKQLLLCSPVVLNAAFELFVSLGFKNFILIGVDMGTKYENRFHDDKTIYSEDYDKGLIDKSRVLPGNFGGHVYTNETMVWSKLTLETQISQRKKKGYDLKVFNMSDGVKIEETIPAKTLEDISFYIDLKNINKNRVIQNIEKFFSANYKEIFNPISKEKLLESFLVFKDGLIGVLNMANKYNFEETLEIADNISKLIFDLPEVLKSIFLGTTILGLSNIIGYYTFLKDDKLENKYFKETLNEYTLNLQEVFLDFLSYMYPKMEKIIDFVGSEL